MKSDFKTPTLREARAIYARLSQHCPAARPQESKAVTRHRQDLAAVAALLLAPARDRNEPVIK